eukprot:593155-Prymnesium_polylepis.1
MALPSATPPAAPMPHSLRSSSSSVPLPSRPAATVFTLASLSRLLPPRLSFCSALLAPMALPSATPPAAAMPHLLRSSSSSV